MINHMSIKNRFVILVVAIMIVLLGFSFYLISLINQLAAVTADIIDHPLEVSNAASYANVEVLRMHRDLKEILLVEEAYEVNILVDRIRVSEAKVYVALDTISYDILGQEGQKLQAEARQLFDDWKLIRSEIIDAVRDNRPDAALYITRNKGALHIETLEHKLTELNQYARKTADNFQENSLLLEVSTERIATFGIMMVVAFVILMVFWVSFNVLNSIRALQTSLSDIIDSGEFKTVALEGSDELTDLSYIFNDLVSSLGSQLWVKEGNQLLNTILSNARDIDGSLQSYTHKLCTYGHFLSVAYYHRHEDQLILQGSENQMHFMDQAYPMGKHAVGECAANNQGKSISYDAPMADPLDMPYKEVYYHPVSYNEAVYGVLVLVTKEDMDLPTMEFIEATVKDLSIHVATYEQRRKIDNLLEDSIQTNDALTSRQTSLEANQKELESANRTLQEQRDLLDAKTTELEQQNLELVALREELFKKYEDLESLTEYRSQFLTNISHELRTPLNSIIVLSNMLTKKSIDHHDPQDHEKIDVIHRAANELLLTINDILDLSKVESGNVELYEEIYDPKSLMDELQAIYQPLILDKGLKCHFKTTIDYQLYGDKGKISHIITNFLSNAIKFTEAGYISVLFDLNDDVAYPVRIEVKDSGIGIANEKFEAIFDEFVQSDGSINRLYGGTGLGLAISKNYAELINGQIRVASNLGIGSTFTLLLPTTCLLDGHEDIEVQPSLKTNTFMNKAVLNEALLNKKILICDDEPMNVFALSAMLEDIGLVPITTLSSQEALETLASVDDIAMVLTDFMMPEKDGLSMILEAKELPNWQSPPVAIITAAELKVQDMATLEREGYILVRKPIIYNNIVNLFNRHLD